MTEKHVEIGITVKINAEAIQYSRTMEMYEFESGISQVVQELGNKVLMTGLKGLDEEFRQCVPAGWRNMGTEERNILSSVGWIHYRRHIYLYEQDRRRKPLNELLEVERYGRDSQRV
ncbi:MAG: hypothetical protein C3F13_17950 [Anaerolineales bacterium]|nr:hypothetical protein [Anaerolineae bacterium]PWB49915.1 MAG: hypothetical protein C3F13_17950 [Anaerolineales bacterium]